MDNGKVLMANGDGFRENEAGVSSVLSIMLRLLLMVRIYLVGEVSTH